MPRQSVWQEPLTIIAVFKECRAISRKKISFSFAGRGFQMCNITIPMYFRVGVELRTGRSTLEAHSLLLIGNDLRAPQAIQNAGCAASGMWELFCAHINLCLWIVNSDSSFRTRMPAGRPSLLLISAADVIDPSPNPCLRPAQPTTLSRRESRPTRIGLRFAASRATQKPLFAICLDHICAACAGMRGGRAALRIRPALLFAGPGFPPFSFRP